MSLFNPITIGSVTTTGNLFAAPLAGYTDAAFRQVCLAYGANLAFTEMVSCEGLWRGSENTHSLMQRAKYESILAVQLFGGNINAVQQAVPHVMQMQPQIIDFNCGCPVPKVHRSQSGSALLQDPDLFYTLLKTLRQETPKSVAVTVKIRSGWDATSLNYLHLVEKALAAGVDMITLHPRTRAQGYSGSAAWPHLREVRDKFPQAMLCGSGDLFTPEDAKRMLEETGVNAVMFARGMMGNPAIFEQTRNLLNHGQYKELTDKAKIELGLEHLEAVFALDYSVHALREFKKHLLCYAKGIAGGKPIKEAFTQLEDPAEAVALLQRLIQSLP